MEENSPTTTGQEQGKKNKALWIIVIALIFLLLGLGSVMLFQARNLQTLELSPTPTPGDSMFEEPTGIKDEGVMEDDTTVSPTSASTATPTNSPTPTTSDGPGGFQAQPTNTPTPTKSLPLSY